MDKKRLFSKLKNPKGPFVMDMKWNGLDFNVIINHSMPSEYTIKLKLKNKKVPESLFEKVKEYLISEGFVDLAEKHNLFW